MLPRIYMSVEVDYEKSPECLYRTSKSISRKLNEQSEITFVHPTDYDLETATIKAGCRWTETGLERVLGQHEPQGDLFIIFGDGSSKNVDLSFAREQFAFLRKLREQGNFRVFLNQPDVEEATFKDYLMTLDDIAIPIGRTYPPEYIEDVLSTYGAAIVKPIFGCRGTAVRKVHSIEELQTLRIGDDYVLQEPLQGPEKRIVILGREFLFGTIHYDRATPWRTSSTQQTEAYLPRPHEVTYAQQLADFLNADVLGVDFIGSRINEINGTGTGLIVYDHTGNLVCDRTDDFIAYAMRLITR